MPGEGSRLEVSRMKESAIRRMAEDGFDVDEIADTWDVDVEEAEEALEKEPEEGYCPLCDSHVEFDDVPFGLDVFRAVMRFIDVYQLDRDAATDFLDENHPGSGEEKTREQWEKVAKVLSAR